MSNLRLALLSNLNHSRLVWTRPAPASDMRRICAPALREAAPDEPPRERRVVRGRMVAGEHARGHVRPRLAHGAHPAERDRGVRGRTRRTAALRTVEDARHLALLALVQQGVVLECTQMAIPLGALRVGLGQTRRALVLQPGPPRPREVQRDRPALPRVYVAVEVFVHCNKKRVFK